MRPTRWWQISGASKRSTMRSTIGYPQAKVVAVFSTKVINDEAQILTLIESAREKADEVHWVVDISGQAAALLLALLIAHGQEVVYAPGRTVHRVTSAYRGESRADARDALVIADQARMRRDFTPIDTPPELVSTLQPLTSYCGDLLTSSGCCRGW